MDEKKAAGSISHFHPTLGRIFTSKVSSPKLARQIKKYAGVN